MAGQEPPCVLQTDVSLHATFLVHEPCCGKNRMLYKSVKSNIKCRLQNENWNYSTYLSYMYCDKYRYVLLFQVFFFFFFFFK